MPLAVLLRLTMCCEALRGALDMEWRAKMNNYQWQIVIFYRFFLLAQCLLNTCTHHYYVKLDFMVKTTEFNCHYPFVSEIKIPKSNTTTQTPQASGALVCQPLAFPGPFLMSPLSGCMDCWDTAQQVLLPAPHVNTNTSYAQVYTSRPHQPSPQGTAPVELGWLLHCTTGCTLLCI